MQPVEPDAHVPASAPVPRPRRTPRRALAALGLLALPIGGTFLVPTVATASAASTVAPGPAPAPSPADPSAADPSAADPSAGAAATSGDQGAPAPSDEDRAAIEAFAAAGYSDDDAAALAQSWEGMDGPFQVKVEAGAQLLRGISLADSPRADPAADDDYSEQQLVELYLALGHTGADTAVLAEHWGVSPADAQVRAGSELKTVGVLPHVDLVPGPADEAGTSAQPTAVDAFFRAGYDYADAVELAGFWGGLDPYEAKVRAGEWLIAGEPLPMMAGVEPGS